MQLPFASLLTQRVYLRAVSHDQNESPERFSTFEHVKGSDWLPVDTMTDQLLSECPTFDIHERGECRLLGDASPLHFFFQFFPRHLFVQRLEAWKHYASSKNMTGLTLLDESLVLVWIAISLFMGIFNLRRRSRYFEDGIQFINSHQISRYMSQTTWESLLACFRDSGFEPYAEGDQLPDGRPAKHCDKDPYSFFRRFGDKMQSHWRQAFVPGRALCVDETMIGWGGTSNMHMTYLPRKPIPRGLMLRTVVDAVSKVMLGYEICECKEEQSLKSYVTEYGKAPATTVRLVQHWAGAGRRVVIADAYFGSLRTAYALKRIGFDCICNVKGSTAGFCKKELFDAAKPAGQKELERNDKAFFKLPMTIESKDVDIYAALHTDKQPMALIATTGSSADAPVTNRRRTYMDVDGNNRTWFGSLEQPVVHSIYRKYFNGVDVHNKLTVGPGSMVKHIQVKDFRARIIMALIAMCCTNAFLCYSWHHKKETVQYSQTDFKLDLIEELLHEANKLRGSSPDMGDEGHMDLPPCFRGHGWAPVGGDNGNGRVCCVCGKKARSMCICGEGICGSKTGRQCIFHHMAKVIQEDRATVSAKSTKKRRYTTH